jgi:hypothetical protein
MHQPRFVIACLSLSSCRTSSALMLRASASILFLVSFERLVCQKRTVSVVAGHQLYPTFCMYSEMSFLIYIQQLEFYELNPIYVKLQMAKQHLRNPAQD